MYEISFNSNNKNGKCRIIFDTKALSRTFDVVNENHVIIKSYKLKATIDEHYTLYFNITDQYGNQIPIDVDKNAVWKTIAYIMCMESDTTEDQRKAMVEAIRREE